MWEKGDLGNNLLHSLPFNHYLYAICNSSKGSELLSFNETSLQIKRAGPFPNVPLIVVIAGKRSALFTSDEDTKRIQFLQKDLSAMSPQGRQVIAEKSGHCIQDDDPEIVLKAIHEVIESAKSR